MNAPQSDTAVNPISENDEPAFSILDVVEAFTAMRHEYRNQTKESRVVADGLGSTAEKLDEFARRIENSIAAMQDSVAQERSQFSQSASIESRNTAFAVCLAEIDNAVSRSIEAASRSLSKSEVSESGREIVSATEQLQSLGPIRRFFCRPFAAQLDMQYQQAAGAVATEQQSKLSTIVAGLSMTADHVRRQLEKQGVQRIDVQGKPFDGELMRAVEVVESDTVPPGHVAEQLSPAYQFENRVIRFADVRIAQS